MVRAPAAGGAARHAPTRGPGGDRAAVRPARASAWRCRCARPTQTDGLSTARESDLVRILDDLTARNERLAAEQRDLQATRDQLASGSGRQRDALQEAQQRAADPGHPGRHRRGAGPRRRAADHRPDGQGRRRDLLDAVEELRDAGAEALQVGGGAGRRLRPSFLDGAPGQPCSRRDDRARPRTPCSRSATRTRCRPRCASPAAWSRACGPGRRRRRSSRAGRPSRSSALRPASTPQYARPAVEPLTADHPEGHP